MIYRTLKQLVNIKSNKIYLVYQRKYYLNFLVYIKNIFDLITENVQSEIINIIDLKKKKIKKELVLFLEFDLYKKSNNKKKILFLFSEENKASFFLNFYRYLEVNKRNLKKGKVYDFDKNKFKNFLINYQPHRCIQNWFDRFTLYFGVLICVINDNYLRIKVIFSKKMLFKSNNYFASKLYNYFYNQSFLFKEEKNFVLKKLSDKKSKKIYSGIFSKPEIVWENYFKSIFEEEHYDLIELKKDSIIINCGIAGGSEIPFFITKNPSKIINIDPDGKLNLLPGVKIFSKNFKNLIFVKKFLYGFDGNKNKNMKTTLSSFIKSNKLKRIDFIKSDIEGYEDQLIDDLPKIVKKFRPKLAISIYHSNLKSINSIQQLVSLPIKLFKICKNYKFFIRHYSFSRKETVMYCIPK